MSIVAQLPDGVGVADPVGVADSLASGEGVAAGVMAVTAPPITCIGKSAASTLPVNGWLAVTGSALRGVIVQWSLMPAP